MKERERNWEHTEKRGKRRMRGRKRGRERGEGGNLRVHHRKENVLGAGLGSPGQDVDDVIELPGSVLLVKRDAQALALGLGDSTRHHVPHQLGRPLHSWEGSRGRGRVRVLMLI